MQNTGMLTAEAQLKRPPLCVCAAAAPPPPRPPCPSRHVGRRHTRPPHPAATLAASLLTACHHANLCAVCRPASPARSASPIRPHLPGRLTCLAASPARAPHLRRWRLTCPAIRRCRASESSRRRSASWSATTRRLSTASTSIGPGRYTRVPASSRPPPPPRASARRRHELRRRHSLCRSSIRPPRHRRSLLKRTRVRPVPRSRRAFV